MRINNHVMTNKNDEKLKLLEKESLSSIEYALDAVRTLAAARIEAKLSASRLTGVARELRELLKVMSVYGA